MRMCMEGREEAGEASPVVCERAVSDMHRPIAVSHARCSWNFILQMPYECFYDAEVMKSMHLVV